VAEPVYVIAGDYAQYCHWAWDNGYSPGDPAICYVSGWQQLLGLGHEPKTLYVGTYWNRRDLIEIRHQLTCLRGRSA
jgi:hypothetical protein